MAAVYAIWKRLGQVRLDGVNYDIGARQREDGRLFVSWVCMACCDQGPPTPALENTEQAIAFAKIGLHAHHALFHRPPATAFEPNRQAHATCESSEASCKELHSRQAAFAHAKAMFDELHGVFSQMREGRAQSHEFNASSKAFLQACRDWADVARVYQNELDAYSEELARRAAELHLVKSDADA
jgi:hypothetical protein